MGRSRKKQPGEKRGEQPARQEEFRNISRSVKRREESGEEEGAKPKREPFLSDQELRRYVGLLILPCVALILIVVFLVSGGRKEEVPTDFKAVSEVPSADNSKIPVIEPDTKEYIMDFGGSILERDAVPEVNQLMEQHFLAVSDLDMDTFLHLFTSQDTSEEEEYRAAFEKQREYIESYQDISCYTVQGLEEDSFVVYVYYHIKFRDVETLGPDLIQVYAVKCGDGQYRIYDEEISPELRDYLNQVSLNEDVRLLSSQVDRELAEAMEADEELRKRITFMKNGPSDMQGDEQPAGADGLSRGDVAE